MAGSSSSLSCRFLLVVLVAGLWVVLWYSRILLDHQNNASQIDLKELRANLSSVSPFWEVENRQLTDELIGEVIEELEKIRESSQDKREFDLPCGNSKTSPAAVDRSENLTFQPVGPSLHYFLVSTASRYSLEEFTAVGLVSVHLRRAHGDGVVHSCAWVPKVLSSSMASSLAYANHSSVIWGTVSIRFVNESEVYYDAAVMKCEFGQPVGANGDGGFLVLNVSSYPGDNSTDYVAVFHEKPDEISSIQFEGPFRFDYAYCSPPLVKRMSEKHVKEWLMYHHGLWGGKVHYFIYDAGGLDSNMLSIFQNLIDKGLLTVINFKDSARFQSQHQLAINDCLQRTRFLANWSFFWDFDEYFQVLDTKYSTAALLHKHEDAPWISLGSMVWSRTYCLKDSKPHNKWSVERMSFRLSRPTCSAEDRANICHGIDGHRKWIANPRKVIMGTVHRTLEPEWNGVILDATIARVNLFHELSKNGSDPNNCWIVKGLHGDEGSTSALDGWWWRDTGFAKFVHHIHQLSTNIT